ncbi:unnamed protein product [Pleuronectes platessa]|uniref:Uncharacterized protein n=1 Tax=Pleuronectes platessa TaxID=8262 RepID=A0A9N7U9L8_PLEPL|nr:unnamed protein product [Pleuronectes platessa]
MCSKPRAAQSKGLHKYPSWTEPSSCSAPLFSAAVAVRVRGRCQLRVLPPRRMLPPRPKQPAAPALSSREPLPTRSELTKHDSRNIHTVPVVKLRVPSSCFGSSSLQQVLEALRRPRRTENPSWSTRL